MGQRSSSFQMVESGRIHRPTEEKSHLALELLDHHEDVAKSITFPLIPWARKRVLTKEVK